MDHDPGARVQATGRPVPSTIPLAPKFAVIWDDPQDATLLWEHERGHWPHPVTPLSGALLCDGEFGRGTSAALTTYGLPVQMRLRRINTYIYRAVAPALAPADELEAQSDRAQERLDSAMSRLADLWATEFLPEIRQHLAFWDTLDLSAASMPALLAHLDHTIARFERLWEIHALVTVPAHLAVSLFEDCFRDLFDEADSLAAYRLLQGFDNKILEADRTLWHLSRRARAEPRVRQVLAEHPAADVLRQLEQFAEGRAFLAELDAYLSRYGQCGELVDVAAPSWIEEPAPVIALLKNYITQPGRNPEMEQTAKAAERERRVAETRERLESHPAQIVAQFESLLKAAQAATLLEEEHNFWIDAASTVRVRRVLVEFGRRFAGVGVIDKSSDVFYLTLSELRETAARLASHPALDHRRLVAGRMAEMAYFRTVTPPPVLGTLPPGSPPDSPLGKMLVRYSGGPSQSSAEPGLLRGYAASPGTVRGPASVVCSLGEAGKLRRGDILISDATTPPWTPLFATAAAVVTDTGGVLSHCAILAREYGIPAVVGVGTGMALIRDGQLLEIDGSAGTVRLL